MQRRGTGEHRGELLYHTLVSALPGYRARVDDYWADYTANLSRRYTGPIIPTADMDTFCGSDVGAYPPYRYSTVRNAMTIQRICERCHRPFTLWETLGGYGCQDQVPHRTVEGVPGGKLGEVFGREHALTKDELMLYPQRLCVLSRTTVVEEALDVFRLVPIKLLDLAKDVARARGRHDVVRQLNRAVLAEYRTVDDLLNKADCNIPWSTTLTHLTAPSTRVSDSLRGRHWTVDMITLYARHFQPCFDMDDFAEYVPIPERMNDELLASSADRETYSFGGSVYISEATGERLATRSTPAFSMAGRAGDAHDAMGGAVRGTDVPTDPIALARFVRSMTMPVTVAGTDNRYGYASAVLHAANDLGVPVSRMRDLPRTDREEAARRAIEQEQATAQDLRARVPFIPFAVLPRVAELRCRAKELTWTSLPSVAASPSEQTRERDIVSQIVADSLSVLDRIGSVNSM